MNNDVDDLLRTWGEQARVDARPADVPVGRLHRRTISPAIAVVVSVVVVLVVVVTIVAIRGRHDSGRSVPPAVPSPFDYDALVVHDGDTVRVDATVLALPDRPVRACAPVSVATSTVIDLFRYCDEGLDAIGVDLDALANRRTQDGAIEGQAELTGTYRDDSITVTDQRTSSGSPRDDVLDDPPCSAPDGGWPTGPQDENMSTSAVDAYRHDHPDAIIEIAFARPSSTQVLMVVLARSDPDVIDAALRPAYGKRLCVIRATITHAEVHAALNRFDSRTQLGEDAGVFTWGTGIGDDWQLKARIDLVRVTPDAARVADDEPTGVVELHPWLVPVRS